VKGGNDLLIVRHGDMCVGNCLTAMRGSKVSRKMNGETPRTLIVK
jgi:hypothetical protein